MWRREEARAKISGRTTESQPVWWNSSGISCSIMAKKKCEKSPSGRFLDDTFRTMSRRRVSGSTLSLKVKNAALKLSNDEPKMKLEMIDEYECPCLWMSSRSAASGLQSVSLFDVDFEAL